jgi:hypothetical protein
LGPGEAELIDLDAEPPVKRSLPAEVVAQSGWLDSVVEDSDGLYSLVNLPGGAAEPSDPAFGSLVDSVLSRK